MRRPVAIFFMLLGALSLQARTLVVEGKYQNRNLYVHNGFLGHGVGFCAKEIRVNGMITTDETNSTSFEIDLHSLQLKYGDSVIVEIDHSDGCTPKVLNIEDLKPKPTFEVLMMSVSADGILKWRTKDESGPLPFIIEQYRWNKWIPVGIVSGVGTADEHDYNFKVSMHSGINKFRVRQKGLNYITRASREVNVVSRINKPSFAIPSDFSSIDFSDETCYEIYDAYGQAVTRGYGKRVNISSLSNGEYYLCYDNQVTEFRKVPLKPR